MKKKILYLAILICLFPFTMNAQSYKTQILILGTPHLQQMKKFEPPMLNKLIEKLNSFDFDVVCIEKMSGEILYDIKSRQDKAFAEVINGGWGKAFLAIADTVQKVKALSYRDAEEEIRQLLKKNILSKNDRKELFYNFLASTDIPSAALQYRYLQRNKSLFLDDFDKYLVSVIEKNINTHNEYYSIALPLAFHKQHNKIEAIDNFQDEALLMKYYPGFIQEYQEHEELNSILRHPIYQKIDSITKQSIKTKDLSALYSFINSEEYMVKDYNAQWKIWLKTNFPSCSDRARFSLWEMRNLQIAANILNVVSRHSGEKIIVIIGSSHKGFLEKYLKQIENIGLLKYE